MSLALNQQDFNTVNANANTIVSNAFAVAVGELVVVGVGYYIAEAGSITGVTDTAGNSYTLLDAVGTAYSLRMAYCIATAANANNVVTATFDTTASTRRTITINSFTPDVGETISYESTNVHYLAWGTAILTGNFSTTGIDEVAVAMVFHGGSSALTLSSQQIGDINATDSSDSGTYIQAFYNLFTEAQTNIHAQATGSANGAYCTRVVAFKSAVAAGGLSIPLILAKRPNTLLRM